MVNDRPRSSKGSLRQNGNNGAPVPVVDKSQQSNNIVKTVERVKSVDTKTMAKHQNAVKQKKEIRPASSKGLRASDKNNQRSI